MRTLSALIAIAFLTSMPSLAFAFTMSVQPARISGQIEKIDFDFDFNGLKDGNYAITIAVPECGLDPGTACALNYSAITAKNPENGTCGYYPKINAVKCEGVISGTSRALISFTAINSGQNGKPKQRPSEKWNAEVKNAGRTERFSQTIFLEWEGQGTGNPDSNGTGGSGITGADSGNQAAGAQSGNPSGQKQKAFGLSVQDFVLAIEVIVVIGLIAYAIGRFRKGRTASRRAISKARQRHMRPKKGKAK